MSYIIIIDKDSISTTDLETWFLNNRQYIEDPVPASASLLPKHIPIDLTKFFKLNGSQTWVIENKEYINYERSFETIEFVHTIDKIDGNINYDDQLKDAVETDKLKEYTLSDLKDKNYDFATPSYQELYMVLDMDDNNELKDAAFSKYDTNKTCFSHPFFYSIVKNNSVVYSDITRWKFYFSKLKINNKLTVAFCINFNNNTSTMKYYDYSQIPPGVFFDGLTIAQKNEILVNGGNSFFTAERLNKTRVF